MKGKSISFGNNCICKILEVEITPLCMKSMFVLSHFVFRKAGFILFKWNYILKYLHDFHIAVFLLGKERKKLYKGNIILPFFSLKFSI